jgi:hypothetical protein
MYANQSNVLLQDEQQIPVIHVWCGEIIQDKETTGEFGILTPPPAPHFGYFLGTYRIFRRTKRTGVKAEPPIFRSIHSVSSEKPQSSTTLYQHMRV